MGFGIKFRPNKPDSPHRNSKVRRTQETDLDKFYTTADLKSPDVDMQLAEWQLHYNWERPYGSVGVKTAMGKFFWLIHETPFWNETVQTIYVNHTT